MEAATSQLVFENPFPADDLIIQEVTWVSKSELVVRATDRTGAKERVALFDLGGEDEQEGVVKGKVVRDNDWGKKDGGWVEPVSPLSFSSPRKR